MALDNAQAEVLRERLAELKRQEVRQQEAAEAAAEKERANAVLDAQRWLLHESDLQTIRALVALDGKPEYSKGDWPEGLRARLAVLPFNYQCSFVQTVVDALRDAKVSVVPAA